MFSTKTLLAATCVAALLAAPARAHDDGRLHVHVNGQLNGHVNGAAIHAGELAPLWVVASLAVAATLLRRRRGTPAGARAGA
jgi:hypothetical protein